MRGLLVALLTTFMAFPAFAQPAEAMTETQRADYRKLLGQYRDFFRLLGKSKLCGLGFETQPFFREVAERHGERSEPARIAGLAFTAGAENVLLPQAIDPAPPAPMPCDVVGLMRGGMRLPELPPSLAK
ncbi:MAG TPA: hypothetical protein VNU64_05825 [Burkholderiales bacterium]|nr:hypothetical protein [Burkholderiales bacterium]